jgi:transcriptional regulator with XRE-family HTH domain
MPRLNTRTRAVIGELRQRAQQDGWSRWRLVTAIRARTGHSLLACHRYAEGWSQLQAAERMNAVAEQLTGRVGILGHSRLSHWESGTIPMPENIRVLCHLYRTRPDRLGFGVDCTVPEDGEEMVVIRDVVDPAMVRNELLRIERLTRALRNEIEIATAGIPD